MAHRYLVKSAVFIKGEIQPAGAEVEHDGEPPAGLAPLTEEACQAAERARRKRQLKRWLALGEALMARL